MWIIYLAIYLCIGACIGLLIYLFEESDLSDDDVPPLLGIMIFWPPFLILAAGYYVYHCILKPMRAYVQQCIKEDEYQQPKKPLRPGKWKWEEE